MKDTIYLIVGRNKVEGYRKTVPNYGKNQIPLKLDIEVEDKAFNTPVIEKKVYINDWKEGIDIEDVNFETNFITEEEAELIRQRRLEKMKHILEQQGYQIKTPEEREDETVEDEENNP